VGRAAQRLTSYEAPGVGPGPVDVLADGVDEPDEVLVGVVAKRREHAVAVGFHEDRVPGVLPERVADDVPESYKEDPSTDQTPCR